MEAISGSSGGGLGRRHRDRILTRNTQQRGFLLDRFVTGRAIWIFSLSVAFALVSGISYADPTCDGADVCESFETHSVGGGVNLSNGWTTDNASILVGRQPEGTKALITRGPGGIYYSPYDFKGVGVGLRRHRRVVFDHSTQPEMILAFDMKHVSRENMNRQTDRLEVGLTNSYESLDGSNSACCSNFRTSVILDVQRDTPDFTLNGLGSHFSASTGQSTYFFEDENERQLRTDGFDRYEIRFKLGSGEVVVSRNNAVVHTYINELIPLEGIYEHNPRLRMDGGETAVMLLDNIDFRMVGGRLAGAISGDSERPAMTFAVPSPGSTLESGDISFEGGITDSGAAGIAGTEFALYSFIRKQWFNPVSGQYSNAYKIFDGWLPEDETTTGQWSASFALPTGRWRLYGRAVDGARNRQSPWNRVNFSTADGGASDTERPSMVFATPEPGTELSGSEIVFSGAATDEGSSGIAGVELAFYSYTRRQWYDPSSGTFTDGYMVLNASVDEVAVASTSWSVATALPAGRFRAYGRAVDVANNRQTRWSRVDFDIAAEPADSARPSMSFSSPAQDENFSGPMIQMSGSATDAGGSGVFAVELAFYSYDQQRWYNATSGTFDDSYAVTGASVAALGADDTTWSATVSVPDGRYRVFGRAIDTAGNRQGRWSRVNFDASADAGR